MSGALSRPGNTTAVSLSVGAFTYLHSHLRSMPRVGLSRGDCSNSSEGVGVKLGGINSAKFLNKGMLCNIRTHFWPYNVNRIVFP